MHTTGDFDRTYFEREARALFAALPELNDLCGSELDPWPKDIYGVPNPPPGDLSEDPDRVRPSREHQKYGDRMCALFLAEQAV